MPAIIENLQNAKQQANNENEKSMLDGYVKYFYTGSLEAHKKGSRFWIRDYGPSIETWVEQS